MQSYLQQQSNAPAAAGDAPLPNNDDLSEFKGYVAKWLELDEQLKNLKEVMREKLSGKKDMTAKILEFMGTYNIEDLNTAAGKIRYKVAQVKEPLSQQNIKDKVALYFAQTNGADELNTRIFSDRRTFSRPTLKRLGGPSASKKTVEV